MSRSRFEAALIYKSRILSFKKESRNNGRSASLAAEFFFTFFLPSCSLIYTLIAFFFAIDRSNHQEEKVRTDERTIWTFVVHTINRIPKMIDDPCLVWPQL